MADGLMDRFAGGRRGCAAVVCRRHGIQMGLKGLRAYLLVASGLRREAANSNPHPGSGLGGSHRVGSRRSPEGSSQMNLKCNFQESLVPSSRRNLDGSGERSDVPSSGPRRLLRGVALPGRRSATSSRISSLRSFDGDSDGSFGMSFQRSSAGRLQRPRCRVVAGGVSGAASGDGVRCRKL